MAYGYSGFRLARFGRIEVHEAVTAFGREALLRAKEIAEDMGFQLLHAYVDSITVVKAGAVKPKDYLALAERIVKETGIPISIDWVFRWICFLPSRLDNQLAVPNRYYGVFQDGSLKVRGIELRRKDTAPFIAATQTEVLETMAKIEDADRLPDCLPDVLKILRRRLAELRSKTVPMSDLLISQRITRELDTYRSLPPAARAAPQLQHCGKCVRPGERVRFLYTRGDPGVFAWDQPFDPDPSMLNMPRYIELFLRAAAVVLYPFAIGENVLRNWLIANASYLAPPGQMVSPVDAALPMFAGSQALAVSKDWLKLLDENSEVDFAPIAAFLTSEPINLDA